MSTSAILFWSCFGRLALSSALSGEAGRFAVVAVAGVAVGEASGGAVAEGEADMGVFFSDGLTLRLCLVLLQRAPWNARK